MGSSGAARARSPSRSSVAVEATLKVTTGLGAGAGIDAIRARGQAGERVTAVRRSPCVRRVTPVATLRAVTSLSAGALPRSVASADCAQTMPGRENRGDRRAQDGPGKRTRKMSHGNPSRKCC